MCVCVCEYVCKVVYSKGICTFVTDIIAIAADAAFVVDVSVMNPRQQKKTSCFH